MEVLKRKVISKNWAMFEGITANMTNRGWSHFIHDHEKTGYIKSDWTM